MKTAGMVLFILLSIWALFSFETTRIILSGKYLYGNFITNPIKTLGYILLLLLIIIGFCLTLNNGFIKPFRNQMVAIEPIIPAFKERNYNVDSFKQSEFIKVYEKLNKNTNRNLSDKEQVLKFIENSKFVYQNLPKIIKTETTYNTQVFNMNRVTQVTILRVERYKHTIILISHNPNVEDRLLSVYDFKNLPDNNSLHKILDPVFTEEILNTMRDNFEMWLNGGFIHGSAGLAVTTSRNLDGEWLWIGVPNPFNDYNLNDLISESIGFQSRI